MRAKWALVTGAGKRLGLEAARALGRRGYEIVAHVNGSTEGATALREELAGAGRRVHVIQADLSTAAGQEALVVQTKTCTSTLDAIVHNAGIFERVPFAEIDRARYDRMQAINCEAPFFITQGLLGELRAAETSCVVHVTDIAAERPLSAYAHYSVSKASLLMLTRALAVELAPAVRVNAVAPGTVMFPEDFDEATRTRFLARIPLGREGSASDVAAAVAYLVCDAPFVTGQVIAVDGGRSVAL
jgi:pteridine reductase